jgi:hypothetical protein
MVVDVYSPEHFAHLERGDACVTFTRQGLKGLNIKFENDFSHSVQNGADHEHLPTVPTRVDPPVEGFFEWMKGVSYEFLSDYDKTDYWAAIAYSPSTGRYGTASELRGRDTALRMAKDNCGAADARPVVLVGNGWCALAIGQDTSAWGVAGLKIDQRPSNTPSMQPSNELPTVGS